MMCAFVNFVIKLTNYIRIYGYFDQLEDVTPIWMIDPGSVQDAYLGSLERLMVIKYSGE
jgi:hypothetical protein